jgi:PilZ domain-containing protein
MLSFFISAGVVAGILLVAILRRNPAPQKWVSAEAQLQLCREIRRPPRIPFKTPVIIRSHSRADSIPAESRDLSIGGMQVRPSIALAVGQPIHVCFSLPDGFAIDIPAVVCRTVGQCFGIRFDVNDRQRAIIGEWVEQNRIPVATASALSTTNAVQN